jgi:membrane fusion protein (multidrug efflux system)
MVKVWIAGALLLAAGAVAYYATEGGELEVAQGLADGSRKPESVGTTTKGDGKGGKQNVAVEATLAVSATSTDDLRAIGTLQSDESVQISSEIAGRVTEIPFGEGNPAAAGDVLVKLDDALAQAELADAQARFNLAEGNLVRANSLARSGNVTERAHDEATTNSETSRAALELAKVRLSKHTIRAPFGGIAGIRKVSPGAYVGIGQPIVNLEKIDALKIDFKLPERYLAEIKTGQDVEIAVDAFPDRTFIGTIYAIDPHLDVNGRALAIRARLANPGMDLRPGLFARVRVKGQLKRNVLVIPESAIVPRGQDKIVYRVTDGQAHEVKVKLGSRANGLVEIVEGLEADAMVVTAGQQRLKDGSAVEIVTSSESGPKGT